MNINNLFNAKYHSNDTETNAPSIYYIDKNMSGNSMINIAFNAANKKIYFKSNEWFFMIGHGNYSEHNYYYSMCEVLNKIYECTSVNYKYEKYNVVPFITSFSRGTAHGYAGLYFIIEEYLKNKEKLQNHKIIVYKNSQKGILDIINYFADKNIINSDNLIFIEDDEPYLFNSIHFITFVWNMFLREPVSIIDKYICSPPTENPSNVCVIKSSISSNCTRTGIVNQNIIDNFCAINNLVNIEPSKMNEIDFANKIHDATNFVTSWGTAFFKNYIYISDKCKNIIVLVIGNIYKRQYKGDVMTKFKNANVKYIVCDAKLNVCLNIE